MTYLHVRVPKGPALSGYLRRMRGNRSQKAVAEAAGVDRSQLVAWENGRRGMQGENIPKMARALNVDPEEILALAQEPGVVAELATQIAALEQRVHRLESASG